MGVALRGLRRPICGCGIKRIKEAHMWEPSKTTLIFNF